MNQHLTNSRGDPSAKVPYSSCAMRNEYSASRWSKKAKSSTASEPESRHFADSIKGNDAVADCVLNQFCSALHAKPFQNIGAVGLGGSN